MPPYICLRSILWAITCNSRSLIPFTVDEYTDNFPKYLIDAPSDSSIARCLTSNTIWSVVNWNSIFCPLNSKYFMSNKKSTSFLMDCAHNSFPFLWSNSRTFLMHLGTWSPYLTISSSYWHFSDYADCSHRLMFIQIKIIEFRDSSFGLDRVVIADIAAGDIITAHSILIGTLSQPRGLLWAKFTCKFYLVRGNRSWNFDLRWSTNHFRSHFERPYHHRTFITTCTFSIPSRVIYSGIYMQNLSILGKSLLKSLLSTTKLTWIRRNRNIIGHKGGIDA